MSVHILAVSERESWTEDKGPSVLYGCCSSSCLRAHKIYPGALPKLLSILRARRNCKHFTALVICLRFPSPLTLSKLLRIGASAQVSRFLARSRPKGMTACALLAVWDQKCVALRRNFWYQSSKLYACCSANGIPWPLPCASRTPFPLSVARCG